MTYTWTPHRSTQEYQSWILQLPHVAPIVVEEDGPGCFLIRFGTCIPVDWSDGHAKPLIFPTLSKAKQEALLWARKLLEETAIEVNRQLLIEQWEES